MASTLETAIAKINSVGDRLCENQVYYFDDYEHELADPAPLCTRLGIPVTDEIVIEYPANRTFSPLTESDISALEKTFGASLPEDYRRLLATFGTFHLPGNAALCMHSPSSVISASCGGWLFDDPVTIPVIAISPYHQYSDGNSIGFIRKGAEFGAELFVFDHELRYKGDDPTLWSERIADSFAAFIISYIDSLG